VCSGARWGVAKRHFDFPMAKASAMEKLGEALDAASNTREGDVKQTEGAARPSGCELGTNQERFPCEKRARAISDCAENIGTTGR